VKKILIFKSDMIGDLVNFSPCLKIIKDNDKNYHITLVCSNYNYQIAKNYPLIDEFIIFNKNSFFTNIIKNFKKLFLTKYEYLFQFDGMNSSYLISYFVNSKIKSTICFVKHKKILNINYLSSRPSKHILKFFYNNFIYCDEKYYKDKNFKPIHYQTNYFKVLENLNFKIYDKKNLFFLDKSYENSFNNFYKKYIKDDYYLFHFDEKWNKLKLSDYNNTLKIINNLSKKIKIIITTGNKDFYFLKDLIEKFNSINFNINVFNSMNYKNKNSIFLVENLPINLLAHFIINSKKNFSSHAGTIIHISSACDIPVVDLIPKYKNDELDRWIPAISRYTRINFEDLSDSAIDKI